MMYGELPLKGGADGLKALDLAKEKFPLLEAVLFGTGPRPNGLAKWIAYYRNPPQDFLVQNIYNSCSIYLCPSWLEGWALPPAEAMSCGCALVSTDIGWVHDYAKQGQTALLSEPRNYQALVMNLLRLLEDDSLRAEVAHNGYALVQQFTWEKSAGALEQKLMDVVA